MSGKVLGDVALLISQTNPILPVSQSTWPCASQTKQFTWPVFSALSLYTQAYSLTLRSSTNTQGTSPPCHLRVLPHPSLHSFFMSRGSLLVHLCPWHLIEGRVHRGTSYRRGWHTGAKHPSTWNSTLQNQLTLGPFTGSADSRDVPLLPHHPLMLATCLPLSGQLETAFHQGPRVTIWSAGRSGQGQSQDSCASNRSDIRHRCAHIQTLCQGHQHH